MKIEWEVSKSIQNHDGSYSLRIRKLKEPIELKPIPTDKEGRLILSLHSPSSSRLFQN